MTTLLINIEQLVNVRKVSKPLFGNQLADLLVITSAFLLIEDGIIANYGYMYELEMAVPQLPKNVIDLTGQYVLPAWCDSHTHLVFAGSREGEFIDKIKGLSYAEIAEKGGGILNSAAKLQEMSADTLFNESWDRLQAVARLGTGAIEIKSGYGLTVESELKMLRVIKNLKQKSSLTIKSTFLGAHTYPLAFKDDHEGYLKMVVEEMLPVIAAEKLADFIDVFCETGFFSPAETEKICKAGMAIGLKPKLHTNQMNSIGGIETGLKLGALSLDHLETLSPREIELLANCAPAKAPFCTLLPTAAFFLRMPFQPARKLVDAGCAVAIASDYNPGSSPSGNMNLVVSMSCIQMRMLPEEAINAATINGAYAMDVGEETGSITIGKIANLIITKRIPSLQFLPYSFGTNLVDRVMIKGEFI